MRFFSVALALLASAATVLAGTNSPTSIRLAFAGPGGMRIGWNTASKPASNPSVRVANNAQMSGAQVFNSTDVRTYGTSYYNYVKASGLQSNTKYYYQIIADPSDVGGSDTSPVSFKTARAVGDMSPYTVNVVGDLGYINGLPTTDALKANFGGYGVNNPEYLVHTGDISYADNALRASGLLSDYEGTLDNYTQRLSNISASYPYMVLPGNHEVQGPFVPNITFIPYRARWAMPTNESNAYSQSMWYSFDSGMVHWVIGDSETDLNDLGATENNGPEQNFASLLKVSQQRDWLAQDLAAVDRTKTPWVIFCAHRPFYTSREHGPTAWLLSQFEPLFTQYGVDLHLTGHNHFYERMLPVRQGIASPKGYTNLTTSDPPVYIVIGGAGNVENHYSLTPHSYTVFEDHFYYGYSSIDFYNSTTLRWQWHRTIASFSPTTTDGGVEENTVVDELILTRNHDIPAGGHAVLHRPSSSNTTLDALVNNCINATGARVCSHGYTFSADLVVAPAQLVVDNNFDQFALQNNAILQVTAYNDSKSLQGSLNLQYINSTTGVTQILQTGAPTSITLTGTVYTINFAAATNSVDPLSYKCSGTYPQVVTLTFDSSPLAQTGASLKTISYTCLGSTTGYWAQGYFSYEGVNYFSNFGLLQKSIQQ